MKKALIAVCVAAAATGFAAKSRVVVLHTNDTHTHIDDGRVAFSEIAAGALSSAPFCSAGTGATSAIGVSSGLDVAL